MKPKFSPGPWKMRAGGLVLEDRDHQEIAVVHPGIGYERTKRAKWNRRLLEAAPDLVAVLEDELCATKGWLKIKNLPADVREGITISHSKCFHALQRAMANRRNHNSNKPYDYKTNSKTTGISSPRNPRRTY